MWGWGWGVGHEACSNDLRIAGDGRPSAAAWRWKAIWKAMCACVCALGTNAMRARVGAMLEPAESTKCDEHKEILRSMLHGAGRNYNYRLRMC